MSTDTAPVPPANADESVADPRPPVAWIVGAGDGNGVAIARRFAREGFTVCLTRRSADALQPAVDGLGADGFRAVALPGDARREEVVERLADTIEREHGPLEVLVFNVGANVPSSILDETARKYFKIWEMACFAGFLCGREAAKRMVARGRGTILFTGATASLRGASGFAAFAGAKHALRALAQSMARELGPRGVHVGHVVLDGPVDTDFIRTHLPAMYAERMPRDGILKPQHVAENFWRLHAQPRDAWTFEQDLRPYMETW